MSREKRIAIAQLYNFVLVVLTVGIPIMLIVGVWLDGSPLLFGIIAAVLALLVLILYAVYPNWLKERD